MGWNTRPPASPFASVAIFRPLLVARMGRSVFGLFGQLLALDFLGAAHHRLDARGQTQQCEQHKKDRDRPEQAIQPVSYAETDHQTGHKFRYHPPGDLRLTVMFLGVVTRLFLLFQSRDPVLKLREALAFVGIAHGGSPLETVA